MKNTGQTSPERSLRPYWPGLGRLRCCLLTLALLTSAASAGDEPESAAADYADLFAQYQGQVPSLALLNIWDARLQVVHSGLDRPWAIEFISSTEVLITEFPGALKLFDLESGSMAEISGLPDIASGFDQTGLLDIEVHPRFKENHRIYFSFAERDPEVSTFFRTAVYTAVIEDNRLVGLKSLVNSGPYSYSPANFGGALEFDDEGYLYVTIGDRSASELAQRPDRLEGKLLRLHDDGRTPEDNPFVGRDDMDARIYALGLRNAQGLHWDTHYGALFETEHGPRGGDEVNRIMEGANYGWPVITYGADYTLQSLGSGSHAKGMEQPLFYYLPSEAISPLLVYRGDMFPEWEGHLLIGALKGQHVSKLDYDGQTVRSQYPILSEIGGRIRDIKTGPAGEIYVLSENGNLYLLDRDPETQVKSPDFDPAVLYQLVCSGCHDAGAYNAPRLGSQQDWSAMQGRSPEDVYENVRNGLGLMPERGMCYACDDEHIKQVVDWMIERIDQAPATPEEP